eukprot:c3525_g1_i1.p1 GENE.c3525_g1_i1~~c3525_g1_i1.p1  ORF type:complete len:377 (+),score=6.91 c3525_g1_i1:108-1238(+)
MAKPANVAAWLATTGGATLTSDGRMPSAPLGSPIRGRQKYPEALPAYYGLGTLPLASPISAGVARKPARLVPLGGGPESAELYDTAGLRMAVGTPQVTVLRESAHRRTRSGDDSGSHSGAPANSGHSRRSGASRLPGAVSPSGSLAAVGPQSPVAASRSRAALASPPSQLDSPTQARSPPSPIPAPMPAVGSTPPTPQVVYHHSDQSVNQRALFDTLEAELFGELIGADMRAAPPRRSPPSAAPPIGPSPRADVLSPSALESSSRGASSKAQLSRSNPGMPLPSIGGVGAAVAAKLRDGAETRAATYRSLSPPIETASGLRAARTMPHTPGGTARDADLPELEPERRPSLRLRGCVFDPQMRCFYDRHSRAHFHIF